MKQSNRGSMQPGKTGAVARVPMAKPSLSTMERMRKSRRAPSTVVFDCGQEFRMKMLDQLLAEYDVQVIRRPPSRPNPGFDDAAGVAYLRPISEKAFTACRQELTHRGLLVRSKRRYRTGR
ncbi:hypothetical protein [Paraburkholderia youngii]|uniref:Uncharacterized protein n=1 Tax=Paraburkholderia youngii TaxID=2782701 RepID=A0A7W8P567_9BURK|nr:hypothetical protein [Paraburkholderia youngii]MBB5400532.1 hypothetical protein [Paraburkholderia youngii]